MEEGDVFRFLASDLHISLDIWTAAWLGECAILKSYFSSGRQNHPDENNPDIRNKGGWTPLLYACHAGKPVEINDESSMMSHHLMFLALFRRITIIRNNSD